MQKPMIRYSRTIKGKKNTLFTFREEKTIYFGIARCRLKADKFNKELGIKIAKGRAEFASENINAYDEKYYSMLIGRKKLWGCCPVEDVHILLNYFHALN